MSMASSAVSELVLFIVSLLVAGMIAGGLYYISQGLSDGITVRGNSISTSLQTDFEIINDPDNIPLESGNYVFYVRNIGKTSFVFTSDSVVVMVDGQIVPPSNLTFTNLDNSSLSELRPYDVGQIAVPSAFIPSGYHRLTVVLDNGKERSLVFKVG